MTVDERIERLLTALEKLAERHEKLTERHEALTQSVELLRINSEKDGENIRSLARIAEIHGNPLTALEEQSDDHEVRISGLENEK